MAGKTVMRDGGSVMWILLVLLLLIVLGVCMYYAYHVYYVVIDVANLKHEEWRLVEKFVCSKRIYNNAVLHVNWGIYNGDFSLYVKAGTKQSLQGPCVDGQLIVADKSFFRIVYETMLEKLFPTQNNDVFYLVRKAGAKIKFSTDVCIPKLFLSEFEEAIPVEFKIVGNCVYQLKGNLKDDYGNVTSDPKAERSFLERPGYDIEEDVKVRVKTYIQDYLKKVFGEEQSSCKEILARIRKAKGDIPMAEFGQNLSKAVNQESHWFDLSAITIIGVDCPQDAKLYDKVNEVRSLVREGKLIEEAGKNREAKDNQEIESRKKIAKIALQEEYDRMNIRNLESWEKHEQEMEKQLVDSKTKIATTGMEVSGASDMLGTVISSLDEQNRSRALLFEERTAPLLTGKYQLRLEQNTSFLKNNSKVVESTLSKDVGRVVECAKEYLANTYYSRKALIDCLVENKNIKLDDAIEAVDSMNVDWQEQAKKWALQIASGYKVKKTEEEWYDLMISQGFTESQSKTAACLVASTFPVKKTSVSTSKKINAE